MNNEISNNDDIIDSRDIIARIDELENDLDFSSYMEEIEEAETEEERKEAIQSLASFIGGEIDEVTKAVNDGDMALLEEIRAAEFFDESKELETLKELASEAEGYIADWEHGETLIRESYLPIHAEGLAEDIGAIDRNASWPLNHIDWDAAAEELKDDYIELDFDGVTYYAR